LIEQLRAKIASRKSEKQVIVSKCVIAVRGGQVVCAVRSILSDRRLGEQQEEKKKKRCQEPFS
jgi:hypothetical protein